MLVRETKMRQNKWFKEFSKTSNIYFWFSGLDIALSGVIEHFLREFFSQSEIKKKRVFVKTTCSPRDPPNDLQNVKNRPAPLTTDMSPRMGSKPKF